MIEIPAEQSRWKRWSYHLLLFIVLLAAAILLLLRLPAGASVAVGADALTTRVSSGTLSRNISAFGLLVPTEQHSLIAMVDGRVQQLKARPGQNLQADEPVLALVNPRLQRLLEEQELALQAQQSELLSVQQQLAQEELQLRHDIQLAGAEQQLLASQLAAKQELFKQQIISALDFAQSEALLAQAKQKLQLGQEKLALFNKARQSRRQAAELAVQRAQKQQDMAAQDVAALVIRSDIAGQLIALDETLKPGSQLTAGQAVGQVAAAGSLLAELKIGAIDAAAVKPGQPVRLNIKGKMMAGEVSWISPNVVDNFLRLDVRLLGELPDTARANIEVRADIETGSTAQTLLSERPAYISQPHQRYAVFVRDVQRQGYQRQQVRIGDISQQQMQILEGVSAGAELLLQVPAALQQQAFITEDELNG